MRTAAVVWAVSLVALTACEPEPDCTLKRNCSQGATGQAGQSPVGGSGGAITGGSAGTGAAGDGGAPGGGTGATGGSGGSGGSGATGGAGAGGTGGSGGAPPVCDPSKTPEQDACVVDPKYGVFVSQVGSDSGDGTKTNPFKTITKALAVRGTKRLYVCGQPGGAYTENITLTGDVTIYGGFDCANWRFAADRETLIASAASPVVIVSGSGSVHLENIKVVAADAKDAGANSIALFTNSTGKLALNRVRLSAGKGADGADGTLTPFAPFPEAQNGLDGTSDGQDCSVTCPAGDITEGGVGGGRQQNGGPGLPQYEGTDGLGGVYTGSVCAPGQPGAQGPDGDAGSNAAALGELTPDGWKPAAGIDGKPGKVGQAGGGGSGGPTSLSKGGGGGCGTCGGAGAKGATGGGASVALLVNGTAVTVTGSTLDTKDGGKGGNAIAGQLGQSGPDEPTLGGVGGSAKGTGCPGGSGGLGGKGGPSGAGAGGVAAGVLWKSAAAPLITGTTVTFGNAGLGGTPIEGAAKDGVAGVVVEDD